MPGAQVLLGRSPPQVEAARALCAGRGFLERDRGLGTAPRMARAVKVGLCWINSWFLRDLRTAFGGSGASGLGREGGVHSLEFYTELRNVCVKL